MTNDVESDDSKKGKLIHSYLEVSMYVCSSKYKLNQYPKIEKMNYKNK